MEWSYIIRLDRWQRMPYILINKAIRQEDPMKKRFETLIAKHRELDRKIDSLRQARLFRSQDVSRLKRIRLAVKDEIQALRRRSTRGIA